MNGSIILTIAFVSVAAAMVTVFAVEFLDPDDHMRLGLRSAPTFMRVVIALAVLLTMWEVVLAYGLWIRRSMRRKEARAALHDACLRSTKQLEQEVYGDVVSRDLLEPVGIITSNRPLSRSEYEAFVDRWRERQCAGGVAWPDEVLMEINAIMGYTFDLPDGVEFVWKEGSDVRQAQGAAGSQGG